MSLECPFAPLPFSIQVKLRFQFQEFLSFPPQTKTSQPTFQPDQLQMLQFSWAVRQTVLILEMRLDIKCSNECVSLSPVPWVR